MSLTMFRSLTLVIAGSALSLTGPFTGITHTPASAATQTGQPTQTIAALTPKTVLPYTETGTPLSAALTILASSAAPIPVTTAAAAPGEDAVSQGKVLNMSSGLATEDIIVDVAVDILEVPAALAYSDDSMTFVGKQPSLYTGEYFDKRFEQFRLCVGTRETNHRMNAIGGYRDRFEGAYQFSPALAVGATWMMMPEAREVGLAKNVTALRDVPMHRWPRYFQDWAFYRVFNFGEGSFHWDGGNWFCNPAPNAESGW